MTIARKLIDTTESKNINESELCSKIALSANQVIDYLESKFKETASYGDDAKDLACYFKSPMMFITADKPEIASLILDYIKKTFMAKDGDFTTHSKLKSANPAYAEYWSYPNGWIVRAANQLNMKDISEPGYKYLSQYFLGEQSGFSTNERNKTPQLSDVLTVAHHGLLNLEFDQLQIAVSAGRYLCDAIKKQINLKKGFYLRLDKQGNLITEFPKEAAPLYFISVTEPDQLHFMIGYPAAFLAILYKKTKNAEFLKAAKAYLDFSLSCDQSVYACNFSHKIAWAASLIYECTGKKKYLTVVDKISDYFIEKQKNGMWFLENTITSYDQSAEIACWFLDIVKNIKGYKKSLVC